jgi:predicted Zn-dependent protease
MLAPSVVEKLIPILRKDGKRALKMKVPGFPSPYFCSFLLRDIHWFNTWASAGSTYRRKSDRSRHVFCDLRVGSYAYDQVIEGGIKENLEEERESLNLSSVPIDDRDYDGLRLATWRLLEAKYREALTDFNQKESSRISKVDPNHGLRSFTEAKRVQKRQTRRLSPINQEKWARFCKRASLWMSSLPRISGSWVDFDVSQETKLFVSTEGSVIVQNEQVITLSATFRKLAKDGTNLQQELVINCGSESELPSFAEFKKLAIEKYQRLMRVARAKKIHAFSGPVLLYPAPAGVLFHEAVGHRLEGSRLLAAGEGQTFKGQEGKSVLNVPISVYDDPSISTFEGKTCIGSYAYDDEGVPAQKASLIEKGLLRGFLTTRSAIAKRGFKSNGHARNRKNQRPISRMAVTVIESETGYPLEELKRRLIREIKRQKKPFGMIVYETSGGETDTTNYDFQAFAGEISYATLIYPNGREVTVRGVNFVGTPLQAINNILACGDTSEVENSFCGAESGFIPITTIAPAMLLSNLELQGKDEELQPPYILPRPKFMRRKRTRRTKRSSK